MKQIKTIQFPTISENFAKNIAKDLLLKIFWVENVFLNNTDEDQSNLLLEIIKFNPKKAGRLI